MRSDGRPPLVGRRSFLAGTLAAASSVALGLAGCSRSSPAHGGAEAGGAPTRLTYGSGPHDRGDLWLPAHRASTPTGVVVLVHGDFWEATADPSLLSPLARAVAARGWAAWNIDYRPLGEGGGWPNTFLDVARGVDHVAVLAAAHGLATDRVAVVGHGGGGTLALWTAGRERLPSRAPGAEPKVQPAVVASLAGIDDLVAGVYEDLGSDAVERFMGSAPKQVPDAYSVASPDELLPLGVPQVIVYGTNDAVVPPDQSSAYAGKAKKAGDEVTVIAVKGAGHYDVIDPDKPAWPRLAAELAKTLDP
jgi:acetyl esterase/lipase